eukprot:550186-Pyramimonas_sp.AAC.1
MEAKQPRRAGVPFGTLPGVARIIAASSESHLRTNCAESTRPTLAFGRLAEPGANKTDDGRITALAGRVRRNVSEVGSKMGSENPVNRSDGFSSANGKALLRVRTRSTP